MSLENSGIMSIKYLKNPFKVYYVGFCWRTRKFTHSGNETIYSI